ncbi:hypothetical protein [Roseovarius indicus]|uniref:hypothetical protein n=1 Tax=Roseovarius indicus TaxID=540747 RepID=UPI004059E814
MSRPKTWGEMSNREKNTILQARDEGELIETMVHEKTKDINVSGTWVTWYPQRTMEFKDEASYRIRPVTKQSQNDDPNAFLREMVTGIIAGVCLAPALFLAWIIFFE